MTLDEFNKHMAKNLDPLRARARVRLRDPNAAEEAVQIAWAKLLKHHEKIDATNPYGYVWVTIDHAIDDVLRVIQRDQKAGRVHFTPEIAANLPDTSSFSSGEIAGLAECEALVRSAVAELSDKEREALRLFLSGVERSEAIDQVGSGYDRALSRAREKMDRRLGKRRAVVLRVGLQRLLELLTNGSDSAPTQS